MFYLFCIIFVIFVRNILNCILQFFILNDYNIFFVIQALYLLMKVSN